MLFTLNKVDMIFFGVIVGVIVLIFLGYLLSSVASKKRIARDREDFKKREELANRSKEKSYVSSNSNAVLATKKPVELKVEEKQEKATPVEKEVVEEAAVTQGFVQPVDETKGKEEIEEPNTSDEVSQNEETEQKPVEEIKKPVVKKAVPKKTPTAKTVTEKPVPVEKSTVAKNTVAIDKSVLAVPKTSRQYAGKYEVFPEEHYFKYQLKASNGEVLFVSEMYTTREGAIKSIDAVKRNVEGGNIRIICDKRGFYKFKLIAKNYRVLVIGANYPTEKGAVNASESFRRFALTADVVDIDAVTIEHKDQTMEKIEFTTKIINKQGGKYEVAKDDAGEFSWFLKANNGEILSSAEGYTTKAGCINGIESFKENINNGEFYVSKDKNGNYQYKLYSKAGRIAALGESYSTKAQAMNSAKSVRSFCSKAEITE